MEDTTKQDLKTLKGKTVRELTEIAIKIGIDDYATMLKQELIFKILEGNTEESATLEGDGLLEIVLFTGGGAAMHLLLFARPYRYFDFSGFRAETAILSR